jgi:hypothetical protein
VTLDGEDVICGPDGLSDFDRMRAVFSRKGSPDVFLYAFDLLELDDRDLRMQSWDTRRALLTLDRCQPRRPPLVGACRGYGRRGPAGMCHGA